MKEFGEGKGLYRGAVFCPIWWHFIGTHPFWSCLVNQRYAGGKTGIYAWCSQSVDFADGSRQFWHFCVLHPVLFWVLYFVAFEPAPAVATGPTRTAPQLAPTVPSAPAIPKEPPPEPEFIADPPSISAFDLWVYTGDYHSDLCSWWCTSNWDFLNTLCIYHWGLDVLIGESVVVFMNVGKERRLGPPGTRSL